MFLTHPLPAEQLSWHLTAYQNISITQITVLFHWTWSCLGRPTQSTILSNSLWTT